MRKESETLELACQLTDEEIQKNLVLLSELTNAKKDCFSLIEDQRKEYSKVRREIKGKIAAIENRIQETNKKITDKTEMRAVECRINYDFEKGVKSWIDPQFMIVKETGIPEEELQEENGIKNLNP